MLAMVVMVLVYGCCIVLMLGGLFESFKRCWQGMVSNKEVKIQFGWLFLIIIFMTIPFCYYYLIELES